MLDVTVFYLNTLLRRIILWILLNFVLVFLVVKLFEYGFSLNWNQLSFFTFTTIVLETSLLSAFSIFVFIYNSQWIGGINVDVVSWSRKFISFAISLGVSILSVILLHTQFSFAVNGGSSLTNLILPILSATYTTFSLLNASYQSLVHFPTPISITITQLIKNSAKQSFVLLAWFGVISIGLYFISNSIDIVFNKFILSTPDNMYICYLTWNKKLLSRSSLIETSFLIFFLNFILDISLKSLYFIVSYPIDFSLSGNKIPSGIKSQQEDSLLLALNFLSSSTFTIVNPKLSSYKQSIDVLNKKLGQNSGISSMSKTLLKHYEEDLKTKVQVLTNAATYAPPISFYFAPVSQLSSIEILLRSLAFSDLNRVLRSNPLRRKVLFDTSCLESFHAMVTLISQTIIQLDSTLNYLKTKPSKSEKPTSNLSKETKESKEIMLTIEQLKESKQQSSDFTKSFSPATGQIMDKSQDLIQSIQSPLIPLIFRLPARGILIQTSSQGIPSSVNQFLRDIIPTMTSQTIVNGVESLSLFLKYALAEDSKGISLHYVPTAIYVLLKLQLVLQDISNILQQSYVTKLNSSQGTQFIRYKVRSTNYMPTQYLAILYAVKEAVHGLFLGYNDVLSSLALPSELLPLFQEYQEEMLVK